MMVLWKAKMCSKYLLNELYTYLLSLKSYEGLETANCWTETAFKFGFYCRVNKSDKESYLKILFFMNWN